MLSKVCDRILLWISNFKCVTGLKKIAKLIGGLEKSGPGDSKMLRKALGGLWGRPRNLHSLEHLKYLHSVLSKNQTVTDSNKSLLVETIRSIAEILIWGDQNDSSVFDFFLER